MVTTLGKFLIFKVPALERMRQLNAELDAPKRVMEKYAPVMKQLNQVGLGMNVAFFC